LNGCKISRELSSEQHSIWIEIKGFRFRTSRSAASHISWRPPPKTELGWHRAHLYELLMNFLFETYGFFYPIVWVSESRRRFKRRGSRQESEVFVMALMTVLCTGGSVFCVRFLIALCNERKPRQVGYWVRLRLGSDADTISELHGDKPVKRAA